MDEAELRLVCEFLAEKGESTVTLAEYRDWLAAIDEELDAELSEADFRAYVRAARGEGPGPSNVDY